MTRDRLEAAVADKNEHAVMELVSHAITVTEQAMLPAILPTLKDIFDEAGSVSTVKLLHQLRTAVGNGNNQYRRDNPTQDRARAIAATQSYVPVSMDARAHASASEHAVAHMVRGTKTDDNDPMDVTGTSNGRKFGVEVKTLTTQSNDKITMHPKSKDRKEVWAKKNRASLHTVAWDKRNGADDLYYRSGVGSYRLKGMTRVKNAAHLRQLMEIK